LASQLLLAVSDVNMPVRDFEPNSRSGLVYLRSDACPGLSLPPVTAFAGFYLRQT